MRFSAFGKLLQICSLHCAVHKTPKKVTENLNTVSMLVNNPICCVYTNVECFAFLVYGIQLSSFNLLGLFSDVPQFSWYDLGGNGWKFVFSARFRIFLLFILFVLLCSTLFVHNPFFYLNSLYVCFVFITSQITAINRIVFQIWKLQNSELLKFVWESQNNTNNECIGEWIGQSQLASVESS